MVVFVAVVVILVVVFVCRNPLETIELARNIIGKVFFNNAFFSFFFFPFLILQAVIFWMPLNPQIVIKNHKIMWRPLNFVYKLIYILLFFERFLMEITWDLFLVFWSVKFRKFDSEIPDNKDMFLGEILIQWNRPFLNFTNFSVLQTRFKKNMNNKDLHI